MDGFLSTILTVLIIVGVAFAGYKLYQRLRGGSGKGVSAPGNRGNPRR